MGFRVRVASRIRVSGLRLACVGLLRFRAQGV